MRFRTSFVGRKYLMRFEYACRKLLFFGQKFVNQISLNVNLYQDACDKDPHCMIWEVCKECDICYLKKFQLQSNSNWDFGIKNCQGELVG